MRHTPYHFTDDREVVRQLIRETRGMSQDKDPQTQRQVIQTLRAAGHCHNPRLADEVERACD